MNDEEGYVISDLHLGAGPGDPLEDFADDDVLADFLDTIARPGATLIINGDFVDFAQIEPLTVHGVPSSLLWDEAASLTKLARAVDGHPETVAALVRFIERGGQLRVTIGNHDLDFAWPRVQRRFREALGAQERQVIFTVGADDYHGVHVEHGYQFTPENCPRDPKQFIHDWEHDGEVRRYLERVWGTDFLLRFFNPLEHDHPYIDNVKPTILVAYQGLRRRWLPWKALVDILLFLKRRGIPWGAISSAVLGDEEVSPATLPHLFEEQGWKELAAEAVAEDSPALSQALQALTPAERHTLRRGGTVEVGAELDPLNEESATLGMFREPRENRAAEERLSRPDTTHVVFGHTHRIVDGSLGGALFNPGSWIPHMDLKAEYVRAKIDEHGLSLELLNDRSLYVVERRAVRIAPSLHRPTVELIVCD